MNICSRRIWVPLRIPTRRQIQSIYQIRQYTSLGGRKIKFDRRDDERLKALTTWQNRLTLKTFPREVCSVTFSRSSGPGGQNVNKLNTKATIRLNVNDAEDKLSWPPEVLDALRTHRQTTKEGDIVISSERHRTQTMNLEDAWEKMYEFVKNIVEIQSPPSLTSLYKIEDLKKKDKARVREWKEARSRKKQLRAGKSVGRWGMDDF